MVSILPKPVILCVSSSSDNLIIQELKKADFQVEQVESILEAEEKVVQIRPALILVDSNVTGDHGLSFCDFIKHANLNPRPIIVFLVDENKPDERIEVLRAGADDAISYPVSGKEIAFRVLAHIRRFNETHVSQLTGLPNNIVAANVLEHCIKNVNNWALLSIDLDNMRIYNETYGEKRGDHLIRALAAVLKSVLSEDDFISHTDSDDFIIITKSEHSEAIAEEICRRFDFIAPRFYTKEDAERGYVIGLGQKGTRRRIQLVSISIGITAKERRGFKSPLEVLQISRDMRYLAKSKSGSDWVSDRLRLSSSNVVLENRVKILIVEPDASMSLLLRDTLEMEGYAVDVAHSTKEAWQLICEWRPDLILMETDIPEEDFDGWELTRKIKKEPTLSGIWLVVTTKDPDHSKALSEGADLYLPKPYELNVLFTEIKYLLRARFRSKILL